MTSSMYPKHVTIFEGPDGSGKTTLAKSYAAATGARYVHLGPFPAVGDDLARFYAEAMLPAAMGYQHVVMDRSWLSEPIYGPVFRPALDTGRINRVRQAMLERLAWRCQAVVVNARPSFETCLATWQGRRADEMLTEPEHLRQVYNGYGHLDTSLPVITHNYKTMIGRLIESSLDFMRRGPWRRLTECATAGNARADVLLVGEAFTQPTARDLLYQWPFASFTDGGCSAWLTALLLEHGIGEEQLCWANADQLPILKDVAQTLIVALGNEADKVLTARGVPHERVAHPQYHKRFHAKEPYPLIALLKERLS